MKGCLPTLIVIVVLGCVCKLFDECPELAVPLIIFLIGWFVVACVRESKRQKELKYAAEIENQELLSEKKEFDRGYYHGFQDGARDANNRAFKSLYNPQDSQLYIEGYACGYKAGSIFDPEDEDCPDFYPEKYKGIE